MTLLNAETSLTVMRMRQLRSGDPTSQSAATESLPVYVSTNDVTRNLASNKQFENLTTLETGRL